MKYEILINQNEKKLNMKMKNKKLNTEFGNGCLLTKFTIKVLKLYGYGFMCIHT